MVRRCACVLLVEYQSSRECLSSEEIAALLGKTESFGRDIENIAKTVSTMTDFGSRYRNMEKALGKGVTLALGKTVSETT